MTGTKRRNGLFHYIWQNSCHPSSGIICDCVCIKGPLVGNLKNEVIKFYDKLGFKVSFLLISCFCYIKKHFSSGIPGCKNC